MFFSKNLTYELVLLWDLRFFVMEKIKYQGTKYWMGLDLSDIEDNQILFFWEESPGFYKAINDVSLWEKLMDEFCSIKGRDGFKIHSKIQRSGFTDKDRKRIMKFLVTLNSI